MIALCGVFGITLFTGFLICVPMLEEWSDGGQVNHFDGWTFQVRDVTIHSSTWLRHFPTVLFRVGHVRTRLDRANFPPVVPMCISSRSR